MGTEVYPPDGHSDTRKATTHSDRLETDPLCYTHTNTKNVRDREGSKETTAHCVGTTCQRHTVGRDRVPSGESRRVSLVWDVEHKGKAKGQARCTVARACEGTHTATHTVARAAN